MANLLAAVIVAQVWWFGPPAPSRDNIELGDVWRFPYSLEQIREKCTFALAHGAWLDQQRWWDPEGQDWKDEAGFDLGCWTDLFHARSEVELGRRPAGLVMGQEFHRDNAEAALARLRQKLGGDNYRKGVMPDHVPWRRFRIIGKDDKP